MKWIVLSPFITSEDPKWLFDYIPRDKHSIKAVPATYFHDRSRSHSTGSDWLDYFWHGIKGFFQTFGISENFGVITAFPQLALIIALLKKLTGRKKLVLIAWMFNLGQPYEGLKGKIARFCYSSVDVFIVHSKAEIEIYSKWLNLPASKFIFVHLSAVLQHKDEPWQENMVEPYIVALGSANRDYATLISAITELNYKTIIVAGKHLIEQLDTPGCVTFKSNLSINECHYLASHARINIIPILNIDSPSGQVTVIESMMLGVPLIATECAGTTDYIEHGSDGLLVKPGDVEAMKNAIEQLWNDKELRIKMSKNGEQSAQDKFTFEAAAKTLLVLMDSFDKTKSKH